MADKASNPFAGRKLVLCVGPGGVGKTTSAAALGLHAAAQGRKVAVVTIDRPAHNLLADSVVLLYRGRVAATGTHDQLLASSARYREVLAAWAARDDEAA